MIKLSEVHLCYKIMSIKYLFLITPGLIFGVLLLATNINDAVMKAVDMIMKGKRDKKVPERSVSMVILMTDGMPNSGAYRFPSLLILLIWLGLPF